MRISCLSDEQIAHTLRQAEVGGAEYDGLVKAFERLAGTRIETDITMNKAAPAGVWTYRVMVDRRAHVE